MTQSTAAADPGASKDATRGNRPSIVELCWLGLAVLVPLAVDPWARSPFVPIKLVVLHLGVTLAFVAAAVTGGWRWGALASVRAPLVVAALVMTASTVWAHSPATALVGSYERGQGLLTLLCYLALILLLATRLPGAAGALRLFWVATSITPLLVAVGTAQIAMGTMGLTTDSPSPMLSTLGRSNFLAAYLALCLPLSLGLYWLAQSRGARIAAALLLWCQAVGIAMTGVRSAALGAAAGVGLLWLLLRPAWTRWLRHERARLPLAALAALGVAAGLWGVQAGGSGAARLATWEAVLRLIVRRPFFGYGPDGLGLVFPTVFPPELVYYQGRDVWIDRAHNSVLDLTAALGVLGTAAVGVLLVSIVAPAWRSIRTSRSRDGVLVASATAAFAAGLVESATSFWITSTAVLGAMLLGSLLALVGGTSDRNPAYPRSTLPRLARVGALALVFVLGGFATLTSLARWGADRSMRASEAAAANGRWEEARTGLETALRRFDREPALLAAASRVERALGAGAGSPEASFGRAHGLLERAIAIQPTEFRWWWELAGVHLGRGMQGDASALLEADACFERAIVLAPNHGVLWAEWAKVDLTRGDLDRAAEKLAEAVDLDATDSTAWLRLGELEHSRARYREARRALERHLDLSPDSFAGWLARARLHLDLEEPDAAREAIARARGLSPHDPRLAQLEEGLERISVDAAGGSETPEETRPESPPSSGR